MVRLDVAVGIGAVDATTQIVAVICTQMLDLAHKLWFSMDKWVIIGAAEEAQ